MASYLPTSGVNGAVQIGSAILAADSWSYSETIKVIECPSFTAGGYMEHCAAMKRCVFAFSGTWDASYNPFVGGFKIGNKVPVIVQILPGVIAADDDAIIESWDVSDYADGKCEYACVLRGDWRFTDFSGGLA